MSEMNSCAGHATAARPRSKMHAGVGVYRLFFAEKKWTGGVNPSSYPPFDFPGTSFYKPVTDNQGESPNAAHVKGCGTFYSTIVIREIGSDPIMPRKRQSKAIRDAKGNPGKRARKGSTKTKPPKSEGSG